MTTHDLNTILTRRTFFRQALVAGAALVATPCAIAKASAPVASAQPVVQHRDWRAALLDMDRWIHLERVSSKERGIFCYYAKGGGWDHRGYYAACHLLRDVEEQQTVQIDKRLVDTLYLIQAWCRVNKRPYIIKINSGFRTLAHNARLKNSARNSQHTQGAAADIRIDGMSTQELAAIARSIGVGGVGVYESAHFVHVDVGRVRNWIG
jgi:uncharacterized protein YcbK (DUF882 family)